MSLPSLFLSSVTDTIGTYPYESHKHILSLYDGFFNGIMTDTDVMSILLLKFGIIPPRLHYWMSLFISQEGYKHMISFQEEILQVTHSGLVEKKNKFWSDSEDSRLVLGVFLHGLSFSLVSQFVQTRTRRQCYNRWIIINPLINRDSWNKEEIERIVDSFDKNPCHWRTISKEVVTKNESQCRFFYKNHMDQFNQKTSCPQGNYENIQYIAQEESSMQESQEESSWLYCMENSSQHKMKHASRTMNMFPYKECQLTTSFEIYQNIIRHEMTRNNGDILEISDPFVIEATSNINQIALYQNAIAENKKFKMDKEILSIKLQQASSNEKATVIAKHYNNYLQNISRKSNGHRYTDAVLRDVYMFLSYMGEYWYSMTAQFFHLPNVRSVQDMKKKYFSEMREEKIFDGSQDSINRITRLLWKNQTDKRCVIAFDAASLTPNIRIHQDGSTDGFTNSIHITEAEAEKLLSDKQLYYSFVKSKQKFIAKYAFVGLLIPLQPKLTSIPIKCIWSNTGNCTSKILQQIKQVFNVMKSSSHEISGGASDGDPQYLKIAKKAVQELRSQFRSDLNRRLTDYQLIQFEPWFFDMLHIIKDSRYRILSDANFVFPVPNSPVFKLRDLMVLNLSPTDLSNSHYNKMDDDPPLHLYNFQNFKLALDNNHRGLALALLPSTFIREIFLNIMLSRDDRVAMSSFIIAYLIIMIECYEIYQKDYQILKHCSKANSEKYVVIHDINWSCRVIQTLYTLLPVLKDRRAVNLGACSSHLLEHTFGNNRRLCGGNDDQDRFELNLRRTIEMKKLADDLNISTSQPGRTSDSGVFLPEAIKETEIPPFGESLYLALYFLRSAIPGFPENTLTNVIDKYSLEYLLNPNKCSLFLIRILQMQTNKISHSKSCKQLGIGVTRGMSNDRRRQAAALM